MHALPSDVISGVTHLHLERHGDARGFFMETWRREWLPRSDFVQGNLSSSAEGVLRGLHYHLRQEDLWLIPSGTAMVALVDLRDWSPSYLGVETFDLEGARAVHIPIGVAHGFLARTPVLMSYLVTQTFDGSDELGVAWNDAEIGVQWPVDAPILSDRDKANPAWREVPPAQRPQKGRAS